MNEFDFSVIQYVCITVLCVSHENYEPYMGKTYRLSQKHMDISCSEAMGAGKNAQGNALTLPTAHIWWSEPTVMGQSLKDQRLPGDQIRGHQGLQMAPGFAHPCPTPWN